MSPLPGTLGRPDASHPTSPSTTVRQEPAS